MLVALYVLSDSIIKLLKFDVCMYVCMYALIADTFWRGVKRFCHKKLYLQKCSVYMK